MNKPLLLVLIGLLIFNTSSLMAQWEPTNFNQNTWMLCQAENGNLLASNDIYPEMGGIWLSEDGGETWEDTQADQYAYSSNLIKDESVYLGGNGCNVAISHDNGETWISVNFNALFPEATEQDPMYAIEYHNDRIYASVFGWGVAFSADEGATWSLTDIDSLLDENNPENGGQWTYNLRSYNGKLYNIGSFGIWRYNEVDDLWTKVDDRWYGGHSTIVDNVFYVSYNAIGIPDGIRYTTDFQNWESMPIPEGVTTSVRFLEYYEGAFFMGHVNDAIFYTLDHGVTWIEYREDFPKYTSGGGFEYYGVPMNLVFAGEDMFCGVFSPFEGVGGVYRAPVPPEVLSVDEMLVSNNMVVYPNPVNNTLYINSKEVIDAVAVYAVTGQKVSNVIFNANNKEINVSSLASGIYFVKVSSNGNVETLKVVKQ